MKWLHFYPFRETIVSSNMTLLNIPRVLLEISGHTVWPGTESHGRRCAGTKGYNNMLYVSYSHTNTQSTLIAHNNRWPALSMKYTNGLPKPAIIWLCIFPHKSHWDEMRSQAFDVIDRNSANALVWIKQFCQYESNKFINIQIRFQQIFA